eukprot:scaffold175_cov414-Prasinococcus_capsulatus_cf.AAC.19
MSSSKPESLHLARHPISNVLHDLEMRRRTWHGAHRSRGWLRGTAFSRAAGKLELASSHPKASRASSKSSSSVWANGLSVHVCGVGGGGGGERGGGGGCGGSWAAGSTSLTIVSTREASSPRRTARLKVELCPTLSMRPCRSKALTRSLPSTCASWPHRTEPERVPRRGISI